ncbi:MAG: hypothetical protein JWL87_349 [Candidatus Adlerbacteria bacterium]|nr:hypothetical protein [Candidatus Adlerbacteria bacterium]
MADAENLGMWQGILTETYSEDNLLLQMKKVGTAYPDPKAAWREAEEFLDRYKKRKISIVSISIVPAGYLQEKVLEDNPDVKPKRLN